MNAVMNNTPGERAQLLAYVAAADIAEAQARWANDDVNGPIALKLKPETAPTGMVFEVPDATVRSLLGQAGGNASELVIGPNGQSVMVRVPTHEDNRATKRAEILAAFEVDVNRPVTTSSGTYNGGRTSAECLAHLYMDAFVMAKDKRALFYDIDNVKHELKKNKALAVVRAVRTAFDVGFARKQALFADITKAKDQAALDAVVW